LFCLALTQRRKFTPWSLATAIAPRTGKIIKNDLGVFERGEHLLQNDNHTLSIVRSRVTKLEFTKTKNFSERGLALKGLKDYFYQM